MNGPLLKPMTDRAPYIPVDLLCPLCAGPLLDVVVASKDDRPNRMLGVRYVCLSLRCGGGLTHEDAEVLRLARQESVAP